jgi:MFS transporter, DHA1 family, tetracycline resistance protein
MFAASRRVLFLTVFIDLMGFGIVVPILAFCSKQYGASGMTLGLILGSFSAMQFLFSPIWGRLSDRIGRRPVLMISLFGNILGFGTFAFASNVAMLFATRIFSGIASASISTAQAYIADTTDEQSRSREMARISMAFGLGLILGPPIGGLLSSFGASSLHVPPNRLPGLAAATLSSIAMLMAIFMLPESLKPDSASAAHRRSLFDNESWRILFHTRGLRLAGSSLAVIMCALASLSPMLVLIGRDRFGLAARDVGYLLGVMGIVVVILQWSAIHWFTERLGDVGTGVLGAGALMLGLLLVPLTHARGVLIVATCLMGVGQGLCHPTISAFVTKIAPSSHRGGILGVLSSMTALARMFGPALVGFAYDLLKTPGAIFLQAAIVSVGIALAMRLLSTPAAAPESRLP